MTKTFIKVKLQTQQHIWDRQHLSSHSQFQQSKCRKATKMSSPGQLITSDCLGLQCLWHHNTMLERDNKLSLGHYRKDNLYRTSRSWFVIKSTLTFKTWICTHNTQQGSKHKHILIWLWCKYSNISNPGHNPGQLQCHYTLAYSMVPG